ncbi:mitochondrial 2-oxoglutarate/malate carrier protein-like [Haliotis asinina]|uniref:mitochondrial 2-oxoglutarate/malate carrier protein-like n=1 Tax=Haliotis asinina TaxID=109174 RepID=UPI0035319093
MEVKVKTHIDKMSASSAQSTPQAKIPKGIKFLFGGSAGMGATIFVQPLDLVKNRMQLSGEGGKAREHKTSFHALRHILKTEGITGVYTGLSAGLLRQATYTTTRLGIYTTLFEMVSKDGKPPNFFTKAAIGITAGAIGAFVGTPAEVALIRMTADGRLPVDQQRGYKNVFNALSRIVTEEGVVTLWRGCMPTVGRAMVVNAAQLASYSQAKQGLMSTGYFADNLFLHFCASMISGLVTTAASMPVDIAKTRIQNMKMIDGKPEYKGGLDVLVKVIRKEGFFSLWKGFTPYYARLGPHTVLTFIFLEQMNKAYAKYVLGDTRASGGL